MSDDVISRKREERQSLSKCVGKMRMYSEDIRGGARIKQNFLNLEL